MAEIKGNGGSLRPTSTDEWEFCGVAVGGDFVCLTLTLNQVLTLGEQCNRIIYSKFAGMKPDKPRVPYHEHPAMTYRS